MSGRREQVLGAALVVLGAEGSRGLTYQAVDQAAGVPAGTTSNYFRNRAALLRGALAHLLELDGRDWQRYLRRSPRDLDEFAESMCAAARELAGSDSARTSARFALFLESATKPELAGLLAEGRRSILAWGTEALAEFGVPDPAACCQRVLAYLDGYLLHRLTFPGEASDPEPGFHAIVAGNRLGR